MTKEESTDYAHTLQMITALRQHEAIDDDEMATMYYETYDELLDDYGIDMHDPDFYPRGE